MPKTPNFAVHCLGWERDRKAGRSRCVMLFLKAISEFLECTFEETTAEKIGKGCVS